MLSHSTRRACTRCIGRSRHFSTTLHRNEQQRGENGNPVPPPEAGYTRLTNRGLISVTGPDSTSFLQGLVTQNMLKKSAEGKGSYTAFLNSQGRILNDAFIYPTGPDASADQPGWLIEADTAELPALLKHLKRHKLRAKLQLRLLDPNERTVWAAWTPHNPTGEGDQRWAAYSMGGAAASAGDFPEAAAPVWPANVVGCVDTRAPGFGLRLVTPGEADLRTHLENAAPAGRGSGSGHHQQQPLLDEGSEEVSLGSYTVRRMLRGVAEGQSEILRAASLPLECNMDMAQAIDFRKGCYVGQELTIRTRHTGVVRKRILPVQLYADDLPASTRGGDLPVYDPSSAAAAVTAPPEGLGLDISKAGPSKGRSAGKFLAGVGNIGLALCRLEMMTDVALTGEATQFTPDREFKISWDVAAADGSMEARTAKIKAFVPPWTREYIASGTQQARARDPISEGQRARELAERLAEEEDSRQHE
ncbi:YgfZ/GcvT domain-containing protein [Aspergillus saccharolyticus JOP 1030-1]|uniref:Iron-sulfur cluster assembly factor IBA57 homolog, mitochondrial n=1 Tax=Aspergillus saccharolyticus JOP 1030-1 TaxID=1450539 RepID=A0A318ZC13_9EURO|nr:Aminomethyltransferase folate-binding domain-containing protein [Aspergillus saccharolyticus JOP 1030-1]PYH43864.1 Aminomethyltransferase folate-binding domain-containing protein [Aspergillus saccharolyticus JOP 1030-1]